MTRKEDIEDGKPIFLFKGETKGTITLSQDGRWIKCIKDSDSKKEYWFDLKYDAFYAHYHSNREDRYIAKKSIKRWFKSEIVTYDSKIAKLVLYSIGNPILTKYSNPTYYIQALANQSRYCEEWLSQGITIKELDDLMNLPNSVEKIERGYWKRNKIEQVRVSPTDLDKELVQAIKQVNQLTIKEINHLRNQSFNDYKIIEAMKKYEKQDQYADIFLKKHKRYGQNITESVLDAEYDWDRKRLIRIIGEYNLDIPTFVEYLKYLKNFEHTDIDWILWNYEDYLNAELKLRGGKKRKMDKYPRNLVQAHHNKTTILADIEKEKERLKEEEQKRIDQKIYDGYKNLEWMPKKGDYCIIVPNNASEVINEGTSLNHCVGTYVSKISDKQTFIVFMRHKKTQDESFITVEINRNNTLCTALGQGNRQLNHKERKFLQKYAKEKDLNYTAYKVI